MFIKHIFFVSFPKVEHARWFKKCAFVRQNRGQEFIDLVQKRAAELVRSIDQILGNNCLYQSHCGCKKTAQSFYYKYVVLLFTQDEQGNQEEMGNPQTNTAISMLEREREKEGQKENKYVREKEGWKENREGAN